MTQCPKLYDIRALRARGGASMWVSIGVRRDIRKAEGHLMMGNHPDVQRRKRILARNKHSSKNPEREGGKALMLRTEE